MHHLNVAAVTVACHRSSFKMGHGHARRWLSHSIAAFNKSTTKLASHNGFTSTIDVGPRSTAQTSLHPASNSSLPSSPASAPASSTMSIPIDNNYRPLGNTVSPPPPPTTSSHQTNNQRHSRDYLTALFPNEPTAPILRSPTIPGPQGQKLLQQLSKYQDPRSVTFFADFSASTGNYIADADGNIILDLFSQIASIPLGYNHPALRQLTQSDAFMTAFVNRPALGVNPDVQWIHLLEKSIMKVAPQGLNMCFTSMCGSCANEIAYKAAFMYQAKKKRGETLKFSDEELSSCMKNEAPGSPSMSILSFKGGFHGRLFGSLSTTRSKSIHKIDIPAFPWPASPFPQLTYPLELFAEANALEESRCLEEAEKLIQTWPSPVAAMIVEPIQAEGGDRHASPIFFQGLRALCEKYDILFIVDEVQTGVGSTGKFWGHEHWELSSPPDIVTFSKKMQAAGFYHRLDVLPTQSYRNFNTWMGDPTRALQNKVIVEEIQRGHLVEHTMETGHYFLTQLKLLSQRYSDQMKNVRGQGTFIAFDCENGLKRDQFVQKMRQVGVNVGGSGDNAIRFRPMLVFQHHHANEALSRMEHVLKNY